MTASSSALAGLGKGGSSILDGGNGLLGSFGGLGQLQLGCKQAAADRLVGQDIVWWLG